MRDREAEHDQEERRARAEGLARARARFDRIAARPPVEKSSDVLANAIVNWIYAGQCFQAISVGEITPQALISPLRIATPAGEELAVEQRYADELELQTVASNALYAALGVLAIAADSALDALGARDPNDESELGAARNIVYMLRCAFAHDPLRPSWECRGPFRRAYAVPSIAVRLDGAALDGRPLRLDDVGDVPSLHRLFQFCLRALVKADV